MSFFKVITFEEHMSSEEIASFQKTMNDDKMTTFLLLEHFEKHIDAAMQLLSVLTSGCSDKERFEAVRSIVVGYKTYGGLIDIVTAYVCDNIPVVLFMIRTVCKNTVKDYPSKVTQLCQNQPAKARELAKILASKDGLISKIDQLASLLSCDGTDRPYNFAACLAVHSKEVISLLDEFFSQNPIGPTGIPGPIPGTQITDLCREVVEKGTITTARLPLKVVSTQILCQQLSSYNVEFEIITASNHKLIGETIPLPGGNITLYPNRIDASPKFSRTLVIKGNASVIEEITRLLA